MTITAMPTAPSRTDPNTFADRSDAWVAQFTNTTVGEINSTQTAINTSETNSAASAAAAVVSAGSAASSATSAANAATAAGAILWTSGTYALNDTRSSPSDQQTYRCKVAGSRTTDPALDPTNWTRVILGAGSGGAVAASGSVVLTNTSGAAQSLTPTNWGQSVTLPNATLCTLSGYFFNLYNNSAYPMRVLDFTGATLGFIASYSGAVLSLSSAGTSAGVWNTTDLIPYAVTAQGTFATASFTISGAVERVVIDANRTLLLFVSSTSAIYGVVHDASTQTWGALTLIRSATTQFKAILSATNQVLVVSCASGGTAMQAVTLTIPATTITVNSVLAPAAVTLGGNLGTLGDLIAQGTSWLVGYARATTTVGLRAITISGTDATIGTEVTPAGTSAAPHLYSTSASVALAITATSSGNLTATPVTVSGSTCTPGTVATITSGGALSANFRSFAFGTRWGIVFNGTSDNISASIVSVSAAVATASTLQDVLASCPDAVSSNTDVCVTGSKFAVVCGSASVGLSANIITDTAGTASKGTALTYAAWAPLSTTTVHIKLSGSNATFVTNTSAATVRVTYNLSAASPTLTSSQVLERTGSSPVAINTPNARNVRNGGWLKSSAMAYSIGNSAGLSLAISDTVAEQFQIPNQLSGTNFISGADRESWNCPGAASSPVFTRIECVA